MSTLVWEENNIHTNCNGP